MNIIPELTLSLWLVVPFLVAMIGLHFILFKPLLAYLDEREAKTAGAKAEAKQLRQDVDAKLADVQARVVAAHQKAGAVRAEAAAEAKAVEDKLLTDARNKANERVNAAIAEIDAETASAGESLRQAANALSSDIAGQILGRPAQA